MLPSSTFFVPRLTVALGGHLSYTDMCSGPKDVRSQVRLYNGKRIIRTLSNYDDGSANITKTMNMREKSFQLSSFKYNIRKVDLSMLLDDNNCSNCSLCTS